MVACMQGWLSIWLYVMTGIGISLGYLIYVNRNTYSRIQTLCTMAIVVLVLHVLEEWVFPGGLHYSYNLSHGSSILSRYPMNRLTDMITNFGAVVLGIVVLKIWGFGKPAGIAFMLFSFFEVVIHIAAGITSLRTFGKYGMNTLYSPGLATSLFGFLPVAIGLARMLGKSKPRPTWKQWVLAIAVMFALCFLLINLPEKLLGSMDSPYAFTDRGYYGRFAESFEMETGLKY